MARPRKNVYSVSVYLTPHLHGHLTRLAQQSGLSLSAVIRRVLLQAKLEQVTSFPPSP